MMKGLLSLFLVVFSHIAYSWVQTPGISIVGKQKSLKLHYRHENAPLTMSLSGGELPPLFERMGVGIKRDIKTKAPHFTSEFKDGFNIKTAASTLFLFFACLAPAVAFGGLLSIATGGSMGTMETMGATAIGGMIYALMSAQPATIIGTTGPLLAFVKVVYDACVTRGLPFLPVYGWIGLWSSLFLYLSAFFSLSNVVEYFTKFTDDIFSSLISVIFIYEACNQLAGGFTSPVVSGVQATAALITALTTFFATSWLKGLRGTQLLPRKLRQMVSDFAPTIGVGSGIAVAASLRHKYGFAMPMLSVPEVLGTTIGRPWLVPLGAIDIKTRMLCALPAVMATILMFMDQNITVRLVMARDNQLKKGSGLHLDMLAVAVVTTITSLLGMPWMVAATVRSVAHLNSLKNYEIVEKTDEGGSGENEQLLEFTGVTEQRISGLAIHALIGAALLNCRGLLRAIPQAVLTGLFLFLGVSSVDTTDLWSRTLLFISDERDVSPSAKWRGKASLAKTKIFTALQLSLLYGMNWIKNTKLGVLFPVLIGLLAPIRIGLEKFGLYTKDELEGLDEALE